MIQKIATYLKRKLFDKSKKPEGHADYKYLTEGSWQTFEEFKHIYDLYLKTIKPKKIIEIGVAMGGTSRIFLDLVGKDGLVVGIDISKALINEDILSHPNYRFLHGFSSDDRILEQVKMISGSYDAILIDGDHTEAGVLRDSSLYIPLIREGGLIMWHDIRLEPPAGIKLAWYNNLRKNHLGASEYYIDECNNGIGYWYKTKQTINGLRELIINEKKENLYEKLYKNCNIYLNAKKDDMEILRIYEQVCSKMDKRTERDKVNFRINLKTLFENHKRTPKNEFTIPHSANCQFQKILRFIFEHIESLGTEFSLDTNFEDYTEFLVKEGLVYEAREIYNFLLVKYPGSKDLYLGSTFLMFEEAVPLEEISKRIYSIYRKENIITEDPRFMKIANMLVKRAQRMQQKDLADKVQEKFIYTN